MAETKKENWFKKTWKRICKFFRELKSELKKVVWPTWGQVLKNALTVVVCVLIVGVFIWIFDMGAKYGIQALPQLGKYPWLKLQNGTWSTPIPAMRIR